MFKLPYKALSFSQPFTDLWHKITSDGPKLLIALAILVIAWVLAKLVGKLVQKAVGRTSTQGHVDILLGRGASALLLIVGAMIALSEIGMNFSHALAAFGFASVGIGFALKDVLGNLFAGVILLIQHPFTIGDQIRLSDQEGMVENIRVRDTQLLTYDGQRVFVPNMTVFSSPIVNYTSTPNLRRDVHFTILYAADIEQSRKVALGVLATNPAVLPQPEPVVLVECEDEFVELVLRFWTDSDRNRGMKLCSEVLERLMTELQAAGVEFRQEKLPDDSPDPSPGPADEGDTGVMKTLPPL